MFRKLPCYIRRETALKTINRNKNVNCKRFIKIDDCCRAINIVIVRNFDEFLNDNRASVARVERARVMRALKDK